MMLEGYVKTSERSWHIYTICVLIEWLALITANVALGTMYAGLMPPIMEDTVLTWMGVVILANLVGAPILSIFGLIVAFNCRRRKERIPQHAKLSIIAVTVLALLRYGFWACMIAVHWPRFQQH